MPEQFLHNTNVISVLQEMRGETMTKGMRGDVFIYFGGTNSLFYGTLENTLVEVVAHGFSRLRVEGSLGSGEDILPRGFAVGVGVFAFEGIWNAFKIARLR